MNINNIKKEFPIFDEKIQNNDLVYLDSANSSQKPKVVLDRINDGSVTDFLYLEIYNYSLFVFNLADAFITIGAILIIYFEIRRNVT